MLVIEPCAFEEFEAALALMKSNMAAELARADIVWDGAWHRTYYEQNDNFSVFFKDRWIGFLSLEFVPGRLFVHTVQLTESAQGRMHGYRIYQWLLKRAAVADIQEIGCKAFIDSSVISLYERLGFEIVATDPPLCSMRLKI